MLIFENFSSKSKLAHFNVQNRTKQLKKIIYLNLEHVNSSKEARNCWRWCMWQDVLADCFFKGRIPRGTSNIFSNNSNLKNISNWMYRYEK